MRTGASTAVRVAGQRVVRRGGESDATKFLYRRYLDVRIGYLVLVIKPCRVVQSSGATNSVRAFSGICVPLAGQS